MKAMGIIFANDGSIGSLTEKRTMASLPFGGRYRQVDFALSNLSCAGIHRVGIVTRHSYQSLMNHVGSGEEWDLELHMPYIPGAMLIWHCNQHGLFYQPLPRPVRQPRNR